MERISIVISPDLLKSAQDLNSRNLKVPEDAVNGRGDTKRWPEKLAITRTSVEKLEEGGVYPYAFRIGFKVCADSPTVVNRGRNTSASYLYNPAAKHDDDDGSFVTRLTIARLLSLLKAVGYEFAADESPDFGLIFSDPENPTIGREVNAVLVDRPDRNDKTIRRQDIGSFTIVED